MRGDGTDVGYYAWPQHAHAVAVAAVVALTVTDVVGIERSALLTRVIVVVVLTVLAAVVVVIVGFGDGDLSHLALGIALLVYAVVSTAVLAELGSAALASATAPLTDAVVASGFGSWAPVVAVGAAVAALGSLLALILGVSRTVLAMARDRHLPGALAAVHPRFGSPYRAEIAVGVVVTLLAATVDVRGAIGFSSFAVLVYYAIANAAAWTLGAKLIPAVGLIGCVVLACALPQASVLIGVAVVLLGAFVYWMRRWGA